MTFEKYMTFGKYINLLKINDKFIDKCFWKAFF